MRRTEAELSEGRQGTEKISLALLALSLHFSQGQNSYKGDYIGMI